MWDITDWMTPFFTLEPEIILAFTLSLFRQARRQSLLYMLPKVWKRTNLNFLEFPNSEIFFHSGSYVSITANIHIFDKRAKARIISGSKAKSGIIQSVKS